MRLSKIPLARLACPHLRDAAPGTWHPTAIRHICPAQPLTGSMPRAKDHRHLVAGALDYSMCHAFEGVEYDPMNMSLDYHLATGRAHDYLSHCKSIADLNVIHGLKA